MAGDVAGEAALRGEAGVAAAHHTLQRRQRKHRHRGTDTTFTGEKTGRNRAVSQLSLLYSTGSLLVKITLNE